MKTRKFIFFSILSVAVMAFAYCHKDNGKTPAPSPTPANTSPLYYLTNNSSKTWVPNPNGKTVYCNNGVVNPPCAMDDVWTFDTTGTFTHDGGAINNCGSCGDGGSYTHPWQFSADGKSVVIGGYAKTIIHLDANSLILSDGSYQDDMIPKK